MHDLYWRLANANVAVYVLQLASRLLLGPSAELNSFALQYLVVRALYSALYVGTRTHRYSFLRTGVWYISVFLPTRMLVRTASRL